MKSSAPEGNVKDDCGFQAVFLDKDVLHHRRLLQKILDTISRLLGLAGEGKRVQF